MTDYWIKQIEFNAKIDALIEESKSRIKFYCSMDDDFSELIKVNHAHINRLKKMRYEN